MILEREGARAGAVQHIVIAFASWAASLADIRLPESPSASLLVNSTRATVAGGWVVSAAAIRSLTSACRTEASARPGSFIRLTPIRAIAA